MKSSKIFFYVGAIIVIAVLSFVMGQCLLTGEIVYGAFETAENECITSETEATTIHCVIVPQIIKSQYRSFSKYNGFEN